MKWLYYMDETEANRDFSRGLLTGEEFYARFGKLPEGAQFTVSDLNQAAVRRHMTELDAAAPDGESQEMHYHRQAHARAAGATRKLDDGQDVMVRVPETGTEYPATVVAFRPDLGGYVVAMTGEGSTTPGEQWVSASENVREFVELVVFGKGRKLWVQ